MHPVKSKIVYCKDEQRRRNYPNKSFDFLGYTFKARKCLNKVSNKPYLNFTPAVSRAALKSIRTKVRESNVRNRSDLSIDDIARWFNPKIQGWLNYYGSFRRSAMNALWRHFNRTLLAWTMDKYKKLKRKKTKATEFLLGIKKTRPNLFAHWCTGMLGSFV